MLDFAVEMGGLYVQSSWWSGVLRDRSYVAQLVGGLVEGCRAGEKAAAVVHKYCGRGRMRHLRLTFELGK